MSVLAAAVVRRARPGLERVADVLHATTHGVHLTAAAPLPPVSSKSELWLIAESKLKRDGNRTENGTRIRIENGSDSKIKNGSGDENQCWDGIEIENVTGIGIGNETGLRWTLINTKKERTLFVFMLAELPALTIWWTRCNGDLAAIGMRYFCAHVNAEDYFKSQGRLGPPPARRPPPAAVSGFRGLTLADLSSRQTICYC
ncbi:hypothetical protein EVAR_83229_1 [Eumeta japonica]|uniref:Uncharacterized protein n=1 Tax=Eumeta variegata TaxID=151549 RepID=A0A4C1Y0X5_EUMVA|nr:hypothetical protein EVAR_83229_1 [Eumeta japonica]